MPNLPIQLYMWSGARERLLRQHDFYVDQAANRILSAFDDIEREAEAHAEAEYDRMRGASAGNVGDDAVASWAEDQGQIFYDLVSDLKQRVELGVLAGLYHQWEKDTRDFIEAELERYTTPPEAEKYAWKSSAADLFDLLAQFGWRCASEPFWRDMDACRLIVNVYKHGKGASFETLKRDHPELLRTDPYGLQDHEAVRVTREDFQRLAGAIRAFWTTFPERLFLP